MFKIQEIELNFCNSCSADCTMCSSAHGCFSINNFNKLMLPQTFEYVIKRLKEIDFDVIQTSGNGDCFLNPWFIDYLRELRKTFPDKQIHNYSSFVSYDKDIADIICEENLITKQHTRIETLDKQIWKKTARMNVDKALQNMLYLAGHSMRRFVFSIGYFDLLKYISLCRQILNREPSKLYLFDREIEQLKQRDQFELIKNTFKHFSNIEFNIINQSLWGERDSQFCLKDEITQCPKLSIFDKCIWISPDGTYNLCGYDDTQSKFICGDIFSNSIEVMFYGDSRKRYIEKIKNREFTDYPCNNPKCCKLYNIGEINGL